MLESGFNSPISAVRVRQLLAALRRAAACAVVAVLLSLAVAPAWADDDDGPPQPPDPQTVAMSGRMTIIILSLITGVVVYYGVQRHRLTNNGRHPAEWDKKMNRAAVVAALVSTVAVFAICLALSMPPAKPAPPPGPPTGTAAAHPPSAKR